VEPFVSQYKMDRLLMQENPYIAEERSYDDEELIQLENQRENLNHLQEMIYRKIEICECSRGRR
jgi:hypothetical protein